MYGVALLKGGVYVIFEFTTVDNNIITRKDCLSARLICNVELNADKLTAVFKGSNIGQEYKLVRVYLDEKVIFTGVVDVIKTKVNKNGIYETIECRSLMAYLLDNHLQPQNIQNITDRIIYERYLKPYGIKINAISNKPYYGAICIGKGVNIYKVISEYSKRIFNSVPRINHNGVAILNGDMNNGNFYFTNGTNSLKDNIYYFTDAQIENRRLNVISKVYVHNDNTENGYSLIINNNQSINRDIQCVRYLDATASGNCTYDANTMINKSNAQSMLITVKCCCFVYNPLGANAVVNICGKEYNNLIVKEAEYIFDENGITSTIVMNEREKKDVG